MTQKVVVSLEAETGDRCVEFLRIDEDGFAFRECERGADAGWRKLPQRLPQVYPSYGLALEAAKGEVDWLRV
ncbi:hypothetical protein [Yoonia sp. 208BN28-4]|uniref:hypothetical protein n=1 Tax=Yoonia sp. 208BN28-4 TaxID=3126505 RepID=UPI003097F319